jgi:hypothetical protein
LDISSTKFKFCNVNGAVISEKFTLEKYASLTGQVLPNPQSAEKAQEGGNSAGVNKDHDGNAGEGSEEATKVFAIDLKLRDMR